MPARLQTHIEESLNALLKSVKEHTADIIKDAVESEGATEGLSEIVKQHMKQLARVESAIATVTDHFTYGPENLWKTVDTSWVKIRLTEPGANKIHCIKTVREHTGLGLADAKAFVENTPRTVRRNIPRNEAELIIERFKECGAIADILPNDSTPDADITSYGGGKVAKF